MSLNDLLHLSLRILEWVWDILVRQAQHHPYAVAAGLYGVARAFGIMIQSGQRGVLFRWGRAVKELEPGFHWLVPLMHAARTTPVRSVTMVLPDQRVMTADGLLYDVRVNFVYRVDDATRALTLVDDIHSACRVAVPIVVTDVLRQRDQAQLVDRVLLDRELTERIATSVARWGLEIEQAGFTTIAPNKSVLQTTQIRPRTMERARALRQMIDSGLGPESALVMIGSERHPVAKTSRRYHPGTSRHGRTTGTHKKTRKARAPAVSKTPTKGARPVGPTATTTSSPASTSRAAAKPPRKWVRVRKRASSSGTGR
jgi:SPFH domain / Band 7 family